jgi:hypothetical protein
MLIFYQAAIVSFNSMATAWQQHGQPDADSVCLFQDIFLIRASSTPQQRFFWYI